MAAEMSLQDAAVEGISRTLGELQVMGEAMGEAIASQEGVIDRIEGKTEGDNVRLRRMNKKLPAA